MKSQNEHYRNNKRNTAKNPIVKLKQNIKIHSTNPNKVGNIEKRKKIR